MAFSLGLSHYTGHQCPSSCEAITCRKSHTPGWYFPWNIPITMVVVKIRVWVPLSFKDISSQLWARGKTNSFGDPTMNNSYGAVG